MRSSGLLVPLPASVSGLVSLIALYLVYRNAAWFVLALVPGWTG